MKEKTKKKNGLFIRKGAFWQLQSRRQSLWQQSYISSQNILEDCNEKIKFNRDERR